MAAGKQQKETWSVAAAARGAAGPDRGRPVHAGGRHRARMAGGCAVLRHQARAAHSDNPDGPAPCSSPPWATGPLTLMAGTRPAR